MTKIQQIHAFCIKTENSSDELVRQIKLSGSTCNTNPILQDTIGQGTAAFAIRSFIEVNELK